MLSNSENSMSGHAVRFHSDASEMSSTWSSSQTHVFNINRQSLLPNNAISAITDKVNTDNEKSNVAESSKVSTIAKS